MARYEHLPIYKATYDLLEVVTRITKDFPKDFKYTLGDRLRSEVIELVVFIYKANSSRRDRVHNITQILERMQVVELLLRLSKDMRLITVKQFSSVVVLTDGIGRQAQGWVKSSVSLAES